MAGHVVRIEKGPTRYRCWTKPWSRDDLAGLRRVVDDNGLIEVMNVIDIFEHIRPHITSSIVKYSKKVIYLEKNLLFKISRNIDLTETN